jgi:hypothetical protein
MKLGIEKTAMFRVRAGISYALTEARTSGLPTSWCRWPKSSSRCRNNRSRPPSSYGFCGRGEDRTADFAKMCLSRTRQRQIAG